MSPAIPGWKGAYPYPGATDRRGEHGTQSATVRAPDWTGALCADSFTPDAWFSDNLQRRADTIAVCRICPLAEQCLRFARDTDSRWGIWGGVDLGGRKVGDCKLPGCDRPNIRHSPYCSTRCTEAALRQRKAEAMA